MVLVAATLFTFGSCLAQRNYIYGELGGAGPIVSLNYERRLVKDADFMIRGGLGYVVSWDVSALTIPTGIYQLVDLNRGNFLELGITYTFALGGEELESLGFFLPAVGYRKYYEGKKGFFKITFSPIIFNNDPVEVLPWGGISFGTRF